jgi:hypothetical protein
MTPRPSWLAFVALFAACVRPNAHAIASIPVRERPCAGATVSGDNELAPLAGCTSILGDLTIVHVSTLAPLASLHHVSGTLSIAHSDLDSLLGLDRLQGATRLVLASNPSLADISQLSALQSVSTVVISSNRALRSLRGLGGLTELTKLELKQNGLYSLTGLEHLERVRELRLSDNRALINARALDSLVSAERVEVKGNSRLCGHGGLFKRLDAGHLVVHFTGNSGLRPRDTARFVLGNQLPCTSEARCAITSRAEP